MNNSKISVRYAKAFFLAAKEEKVLEKVLGDMKLIRGSYSTPGFKEFLESPVIKTSETRKLIKNVFEKNLENLTLNF